MQDTETIPASQEQQPMHCMEVWGGSGLTNSQLVRPGLDVWVWSRQRGQAEAGGGDLHLLSSCASGRITRMLLADVCGFGSLFAEVASELRDLMKSSVNSIQQAKMVRHMTSRLDEASQRGCFASTLISTYFAPTRSFTLCNAGHPPPLLFRARSQEWSVLKQPPRHVAASEKSLGVLDPKEYQQFSIKLEVGDMVLSYSNALTECRSERGSTIGLNGVLNRVRQCDATRPSELVSQVISQLEREHVDNLAANDATILLCRASASAVRWQDNLLAPFRLLRSATDATRID